MIDSASEQPARRSGISTVLVGFSSFAVSAMKWTPASTMTSASTFMRLARQRQAVADDVGDAVEDLRRLVVVRQDDGVALALQRQDGVDVVGEHGPFHRRDDGLDPVIQRRSIGHGGFP